VIAPAARHPDGVPGFRDGTWWARLAQPDLFAGTAADPRRLGANPRDPKGGGPEAVAWYGVLRPDTGGMVLRFCDGRPVSATAEEYLGWVCRGLAAEGKRVFVPAWGNAARHVSQRVRRWIARHNRRVRRDGGCRTRVCGLPVKARWLHPIEPKWVHGQRAVAEPDRELTAGELRPRVCDYFGGPQHPLLPKPQA
jgi:hypothetical protein